MPGAGFLRDARRAPHPSGLSGLERERGMVRVSRRSMLAIYPVLTLRDDQGVTLGYGSNIKEDIARSLCQSGHTTTGGETIAHTSDRSPRSSVMVFPLHARVSLSVSRGLS